MSHARTALASLAGLALSVGMVTGAATLSSADEARGKEKAPCSQEQKQYDKAVDKYERLHAKFATEKQEAAEAEGTDDEKAEKRQARKAQKAKKAQAKRVEKKQAKLERCQAEQEPTEEPSETTEPSETSEPTEEPTTSESAEA